MSSRSHPSSPIRTAGWLSVAAGVVFLATVTYLFTVLPATGWDLAMFDEPARLLVWVDGHERIYQGLWLCYFASQACLLAAPSLLAGLSGRTASVFGTVAVVLAMVGLVVLFAVSPVLAHAYREAAGAGASGQPSVLTLHDVTADVGKDLRLFSELLLGVWLAATGRALGRTTGRRLWWLLTALGGWTFVVAGTKLFVPTIGLEDWLGFLLGLGYLGLGVGLVRGEPGQARVANASGIDDSPLISSN